MAGPSQKRKRVDGSSKDTLPAKRVKSAKSKTPANFSPAFWDNLSKVSLTSRALRELDRRNKIRAIPRFAASQLHSKDIARFARHGGPGVGHLRGYPNPENVRDMSSNVSSTPASRRTTSTEATKTRRSSAYDDDFEQHLADHNINPLSHPSPVPADLRTVRAIMARRRSSLSPSRFTEEDFRRVKEDNGTISEGSVMRNVITTIAGTADVPNEGHLPFTNLSSLTEEKTVKAVPDYFDGARRGDLKDQVRRDLNNVVIPTKHMNVPVAPNLFLEAKGLKGSLLVARRQACYDGAHGARAMHSLQNYGKDAPQYDYNAYTFSSTYGDGVLRTFAHYVTPSATEGDIPEYHMVNLKSFTIMDDREDFIAGATAFRNLRDLAKRYRDDFIRAANSRVHPPSGAETVDLAEADSISNEFVDCEDHITPQDSTIQVTSDFTALPGGPSDLPEYLHDEDDSQPLSQPSVVADFDDPLTSSFTSNVTESSRSKRRLSPRPGTDDANSSKSRIRPNTRASQSTSAAADPVYDAEDAPAFVTTYWRKGKLYFKNTNDQEIETKEADWIEKEVDDGTRSIWWQSPESGRLFQTSALAGKPDGRRQWRRRQV